MSTPFFKLPVHCLIIIIRWHDVGCPSGLTLSRMLSATARTLSIARYQGNRTFMRTRALLPAGVISGLPTISTFVSFTMLNSSGLS